jgi:hypothetical protein
MAIPKLKIVVGADTDPLKKGLGDSGALVKSFAIKATAALVAVKAATFALGVASLRTIDAQAKLAKSLGTTTKSIQIMERAGDLAGVAMSGVEQATKDLTRRLSQAAGGTGPAADALNRLKLTAGELYQLPLDERVSAINAAIEKFIPAAERAAVAGQLFGEEGSIAMARIDPATIRQATQEIDDFGVAVSEVDAARIQQANDAISRLSLITKGLGNRVASQIAPALENFSRIVGDLFKRGSALTNTLSQLFARVPAYTATVFSLVGAMVAYRAAVIAASFVTSNFKKLLVRSGIGIFVVALGEAVFWAMKVVKGLGGIGEAVKALQLFWKRSWLAMSVAGESLFFSMKGVFVDVQKFFASLVMGMQKRWADFLHSLAEASRANPLIAETKAVQNLGVAAIMAGSKYHALAQEVDNLGKRSEAMAALSGKKWTHAANIADTAWRELKDTISDALLVDSESSTAPLSAASSIGSPGLLGTSSGATEEGESKTQSGSRGSKISAVDREIEAIKNALFTTEELQLASYERQKEALTNFLKSRTGAHEEHAALLQRVEDTHQFKMMQSRNAGVKGTLKALGQVFQGSKKIGAAIGVTNSWLAFTEVLKDPSFVGNPLGRIAAASSALAAGLNAVRNIKSGSKSASSAGGGTSAAGGGQSSSSGGNVSRNVAIRLEGQNFGQEQIRGLINQINEAVEGGAVVRLV